MILGGIAGRFSAISSGVPLDRSSGSGTVEGVDGAGAASEVSALSRLKQRLRRASVPFSVEVPFDPSPDQQRAVGELAGKLACGDRFVTLLGITGSGKSAAMAWTVERLQRPALVLAPNKSLAAQLAAELKAMMPGNSVCFFVSYYDYYQPEAYVPSSDTFIEKESQVNAEIDRLRHEATASLLLRRDTVVVASVSCIYGLGAPESYLAAMVPVAVGDRVEPLELARALVDAGYSRNDVAPSQGQFRVRGDVVEVYPPGLETGWRVGFFGDEVEALEMVDRVSGPSGVLLPEVVFDPVSHYVTEPERLAAAVAAARVELAGQVEALTRAGKLVEAQRLTQRTEHDLELLEQTGFCPGVENYSRHLEGRPAGSPPGTLLDYFDDDFVVFVDESHVTVPQLNAAYAGDASRKRTLVEHGFRLPSALDNRPLRFEEFLERAGQVVSVSATPGPWELSVQSSEVVELLTRPTGLLDPLVEVHPRRGQLEDLLDRVRVCAGRGERVLVTTTTKQSAEDLVEWLSGKSQRARFLHSDVDTVERQELTRALRLGEFDVLVGVNLLREGLDLPEVSLVAVLDADVEGFLRSKTALIQTMGRAARNVHGHVVLYADRLTPAMVAAMEETGRRRRLQEEYNALWGVEPSTVPTPVRPVLLSSVSPARGRGKPLQSVSGSSGVSVAVDAASWPVEDLVAEVERLRGQMAAAAEQLRFEEAARLRDELVPLEELLAARGA